MESKDFFRHWFDKNMHKFSNPGVYLGTEPGTEKRDWSTSPLNICVVAASTYDNLTGNLASPILTRMLLEADPNWVVERAFFPNGRKDLELFMKNKIPVFSLESKRRLSDFDILCCSCSFQGLDLNVIKILDMCKIPILQTDRALSDQTWPWILRGGQNDCNPTPFMNIYDLCYIGEAEVNLVRLLKLFAKAKRENIDRDRVKKAATKLDGCLVPEFYTPHYNQKNPAIFEGWTKTWEGAPLPVKAARIKDLNSVYLYRHPIMNYSESMGSGEILISKGCFAKCNFCVSEDTLVWTRGGLVKASEVNVGDEVATDTGWEKITKFWNNGERNFVRLTLKNGAVLDVTEDHCFRDYNYKWREAHSPGAYLAFSKRNFSLESVDSKIEYKQVVRNEGRGLTGRHALQFDFPKYMSQDLAWLLGYSLGDANLREYGVRFLFRKGRFKEEQRIEIALKSLGIEVPTVPYYGTSDEVLMKEVGGLNLSNFLKWGLDNFLKFPTHYLDFLIGWAQADGGGSTVSGMDLVTTSEEWAQKGFYMAAFCGLSCRLKFYSNKHKGRFILHFREFPDLDHKGILLRTKGLGSVKNAPNPEWFSWVGVKSLEQIGKKKAINFTVAPSHCYIAGGVVNKNCNEGWKEKPYREMDPDLVIEVVKQNMIESGAADCTLSAFCVSSYRRKKYVMKRLMEEVSPHVGLTSQRADESAADPEFMKWTAAAGNRSVSFGVEGMSERLRTLVSKHASQEIILKAVGNAVAGGYNKIKLFCISNLPTECEADREEWLLLAAAVRAERDKYPNQKCQIKFQFTDITITPWTPFMWNKPTQGQRNLSPYIKRIKECSGLRVSFGAGKGHDLDSILQTMYLSDPRLLPVLIRLATYHNVIYFRQVQKGAFELMLQEIEAHGLKHEWWWRERAYEETLPWELITYGMKKSYLWKVWQRALKGEQTPKCNQKCEKCGALTCEGQLLPIEDDVSPPKQMELIPVDQHLVLKLKIDELHRFVPASARKQLIRRALYMQDAPTMRDIEVVSDTFRNEDWNSGVDYAAVRLTRKLNEPPILESLCQAFEIESTQLRSTSAARLFTTGVMTHSKIKISHPIAKVRSGIDPLLKDPKSTISVRVTTQMGVDVVKLKVRDNLFDLWITQESDGFYLNALHDGGVSANDIYQNVARLRSWIEVAGLPATRVEVYVRGQELGAPKCSFCKRAKVQTVSGEWRCLYCE